MRRVVWLSLLLLGACDSSRIYEDNFDFDGRIWLVSEKPIFEFQISDPGKTYNVYYNLRNSSYYPYSDFFLQYTLSDSTGVHMAQDLVSAYLFDEVTGKPLGSSGIGDIYDHQFPLLKGYQFPRRGKYAIQLEQFTRQDTLAGILAVGIRVEVNGQ